MNTLAAYLLVTLLTAGSVVGTALDYPEGRPEGYRDLERSVARWEATGQTAVVVDSAIIWLNRRGYLDAVASRTDAQLTVTAGSRYVLGEVLIESDAAERIRFDVLFTEDNVQRAIDSVLSLMADRGHYYARADVVGVEASGLDIMLRIKIAEGPAIVLGRSVFNGLKHSSRAIIERYLSIGEDSLLTDRAVRQAERDARSIPFVTFLPPVKVRPRPGFNDASLVYEFREKERVYVFGGGGYIPDDPTGVVWQLDVRLANLLGGGREAKIRSERREKGRNLLEIDYHQPVFWPGIGDVGLSVKTRDYRDDFYEFGIAGRFHTRIAYGTESGVNVSWRHVEPSDDSPGFAAYSLGFNLDRTRLDHSLNPSRGTSLSMELAYTHRRYSHSTDSSGQTGGVFNETQSNLQAGWFAPVSGRLVWHMRLAYRGLETGDSLPPVSELALIGGPGTLRGYRNEQFAAQRAALVTLEPRVRFSGAYLFLFYDAAYVNRPTPGDSGTVDTDEQYHWAAGLGFAVIQRDRFLKLSFGWNPDDDWDQPRVSMEFSTDL